ncbi:MAG: TIGR00730 family Rossman fold protein [Planctomycetes bacterium]|nr:TIGR00730 family Rossman fold protein [Planctomycetota bacterium]
MDGDAEVSRPAPTVCVYCASSPDIDAELLDLAHELGRRLARSRMKLVYGAGSTGCMGRLADGALSGGGEVLGVIPRFMMEREWNHPHIGETITTETMQERKLRMLGSADVVVCLPGGTGTLEEIAECLSLKRLGLHAKPIAFVNWRGFFDPLVEQIERFHTGGFLGDGFRGMFTVCDSLDALFTFIDRPTEWINPLYPGPTPGGSQDDIR